MSYRDPTWRKEQEEKARALGNESEPDVWMRYAWTIVERDSKGVSLSKASLGAFTYEILIRGGDVYSLWGIARTHGASIFPSVKLTVEAKEDLESKTKYRLMAHPKVRLS